MNQEDEYKRTIVQASLRAKWHQNRGLLRTPGQVQQKPVYRLVGVRRKDSVSLIQARLGNWENSFRDVKGRGQVKKSEAASTDVRDEGGPTRSSVEATVMVAEQRGRAIPVNLVGQLK